MRPLNEGSRPAARQGGFPRKSTNPTDADSLAPAGDSSTTGSRVPVVTTPLPWLRAVRRTKMPLAGKGVALALVTYANKDGTNAHPGEARLAADCGINEQSVRRHLAALRDVGLIVRTFRAIQPDARTGPIPTTSPPRFRTPTTGHQLLVLRRPTTGHL
jgi:hypothetical protein